MILKIGFIKKSSDCSISNFNARVERDNIFKPTIGSENLHPESNANGIRSVNFVTVKSLIVNNTVFPHCNIHKYT